MSTAIQVGPPGAPAIGASGRRLRTRRRSVTLILSVVWLGVVVLAAASAQLLPIHDYIRPVGTNGMAPGWRFEFLGTDQAGRSMLSRLIFGAQISFLIGLGATALGMLIGGLLGLASVYFGGLVTWIVDLLANTVLAVPSVLMLLAIAVAIDPTVPVLIVSLSVITIPAFMRITRANALSQMNKEYVLAARSMGANARRVMFRELLPNTFPSVLSYGVVVLPTIIIVEGSLSFLGRGVHPPRPSWGSMIAGGRPTLATEPWQALLPCTALFLTVFALNSLGDWAKRRFEIRDDVE